MHYILWLSCELVFEKVVTIYSLLLCHMRYQQGLVEHDTPATKHPPLPLLHTPHIINNIFQPLLRPLSTYLQFTAEYFKCCHQAELVNPS